MEDLFSGMDLYLKTLWIIALAVSLVFVIQVILTFIGMDGSDGVDVDFDGHADVGATPFQLFSLRNLTNFLLGFSWGGIAFYDSISNKLVLSLVALLIGVGMLFLFFFIIKQIMKLSQNNAMDLNSAIGETCEVYLIIPENGKGKGKVHVKVNQTLRELDAMTDGEKLPTGSIVKVVAIINETILKVEKI